MSSFRVVIARTALAASLCVVALAGIASAQEPLAAPPMKPEFMPRFDWHLKGNWLAYDDERFSWDTHWFGDFDLASFKRSRVTFLADYQALLGNEFRPFDPYQSNYRLEASGSAFIGRTEVALLLNHVSRHLGDRPNRRGIAENSLGPRVLHRFGTDATTLDVRVEVRKVIARAYVDYTWMNLGEVVVRRRINERAGLFGRGYAEVIPVDPTIANRDTQRGGRGEGGVRLTGTKGAVELYGGYEQVIDADPLDRLPRRWFYLGFRLLSN